VPLQRTIVITGVSRGLGRELVRRYVVEGHRVAGCARSADAVAELRHELGDGVCIGVVDVRDDDAVAQWAADVVERLGAPDLLVNNAALMNANAPVWKIPVREFDDVVDVNVKGVANVLRHFVPAMIAAGTGVIVNISSEWGRSTSPEVGAYCATKWAIEGLTRSLAQELPTGLAAVPVNPGIIDTAMLRSCFGPSAAHYAGPEDWAARAAPFLLSLNGSHSGQPVSVPD